MKITRNNVTFEVVPGTQNDGFWQNDGWENETYSVLGQYLRKDKVYIDVGAWIGPTVLYASQLSKKVYTFEPDPVTWDELSRNIALNGYTNVFPQNVALSDKNETIQMGSDNRLGESVTRAGNFNNGTQFTINTISTDEFLLSLGNELDEVNFVKVDIEGGEINVCKSSVLRSAKIPMLLSIHPPMIAGYRDKVNSIVELASAYNSCEVVGFGKIRPTQIPNIPNYFTVLLT